MQIDESREEQTFTRRSTLVRTGGYVAAAAAILVAPETAQASAENPFVVVDPAGGGDFTDLEVAVRSVPSNSMIFVRRGTYIISDSLRPAAGVRIVGEGYGTEVRANAGLNKNVFFIEHDYVVLENLRVNGNRANQQVGKSTIDYQRSIGGRVVNCWAHSAGGYGIVAYPGCRDFVITGNLVWDTSDGIELGGASNCAIVGNTCVSNGNGMNFWNSTGDCAFNAITGNTISNSSGYGIVLGDGAHDNVVGGNTCDSNALSGIFVGNGGSGIIRPANGNTITANVVTNSGRSGILLNGVADIIASNNILRNNGLHGLWARYPESCSIIGNTAVGNMASGLRVEGVFSASPARGIMVASNICRNNGRSGGDGISVFGALQVTIVHNCCYDTQSTKTQRYGISVADNPSGVPNDNLLVGPNLVDGNRDAGLSITSDPTKAQSVPYRKVSATVDSTQTAVPHGLPYAPRATTITMRSPGSVWQSAPPDAVNVYLTADSLSRQVDILVG